MSGSSWKVDERKLAARLGVTRNPSNGRRQNDIDAGEWAIEVKKTKSFPALFKRAMIQAREGAKAAGRGQIPIVAMTDAPGRGQPKRTIVIMDFDDFANIYDRLTKGQTHAEGTGQG